MTVGCGYIPPRRYPFDEGVDSGGCDLSAGHAGMHAAFVRGRRYVWQSDDDCDCCDPADSDRCFTYGDA